MTDAQWESLSNQGVAAAGVVYFLALLAYAVQWAALRDVPVRQSVAAGGGGTIVDEPRDAADDASHRTEMAGRLGVTRSDGDPVRELPSFTLGPEEVSPLTMAEAMATLAARGLHCEPYPVTEVLDRDGDVILSQQPDCQQALDPKWADATAYALQGVMQPGGTGSAVALDRPSAGKTGTTSNFTDAYFDGYTSQLATAVWVGYPNETESMPDGFGGTLAAPIWHDYMQAADDGFCSDFAQPTDPWHGQAFHGDRSVSGKGSDSGSTSSGFNAGTGVSTATGTATRTATTTDLAG